MRRFSLALCTFLLAVAPATRDDFALNLFRTLRSKKGNVVMAPSNVAVALTLVRRGAGGATARELDQAVRSAPARDPNVVDVSALWVDGRVHVMPWFATAARDAGGSVRLLSFADPGAARGRMNAWVREVTGGRIDQLIGPGVLTPGSRMVVTAATHMKATWRSQFDPGDTRSRPFHIAPGRDVRVPTMSQILEARYAAVGRVQLLELRYDADGLSMLIVLPNYPDALPAVEASLTPAQFARWTAALKPRGNLDLRLPRFHTTTDLDLRSTLDALGVHRLFDHHGAELPGIQSAAPLYVTEMLQRIRIDVDEEGTEASAAEAGSFGTTGTEIPPPPQPFYVDHPFLYVIRSGECILFLGRVTDPRG